MEAGRFWPAIPVSISQTSCMATLYLLVTMLSDGAYEAVFGIVLSFLGTAA